MSILLILILCMFGGVLLRHYYSRADLIANVVRKFLIWICLPALVFVHIPKIAWEKNMLFPLLTPYIAFALSITLGLVLRELGKRLASPRNIFSPLQSKPLLGCFILMCGFGNTAFVGYPVIQVFYGAAALKTAIILDQGGSFVALTSLGVLCASYFSGAKLTGKQWLKKTFAYPSFMCFLIALLMNFQNVELSESLQQLLRIVAAPLSYLALFLSGLNLRLRFPRSYTALLSVGLSLKLIFIPALIMLIFLISGYSAGIATKVCVLEAAMPPMVSAAIISLEYRLEEELAMLFIAVGIPLSFLSLFLYYHILEYIY